LTPSAPICAINSASAVAVGAPSSRVPVSQASVGKKTRTPRAWNSPTMRRSAGNSAGHVANQVELIAVVRADVGIERPDQDGVDGAEASLDIREKPVDRVSILVRIEERAVPDQHLDLRIDVLRPRQLGPRVLRAIVAQSLEPFLAPRFHFRPPRFRGRRTFRPRQQHVRRTGRLGQIHHARRRDQRMPRTPFIGKQGGRNHCEDGENIITLACVNPWAP
jgi:hypothetical protein